MVFSAGESNIAVFAINQRSGEPTAIQHANIRAAHPRTFGLETGARLLVAGSLAPSARRAGVKVVTYRLAFRCSACVRVASSTSCGNTTLMSASLPNGGLAWSRLHDSAWAGTLRFWFASS
jgi:Lactonase, 7-bladed beta-propeller